MPQLRAKRQRQLFDEKLPPFPPSYDSHLDVQDQLRQALVQWMQALAKRIHREASDE